jgi:outer membrane autotransporter protein
LDQAGDYAAFIFQPPPLRHLANITATNTTIDVNGTASDWAILAFAMPNTAGISHMASVNWSGPHLGSSGNESGGIQADNRGNGNAIVVASGDINVVAGAGVGNGTTQYGLLAHAGDPLITGVLGAGDASATYNSGTINVNSIRPRGILAWVDGHGSVTVTTGAGTVINVSGTRFGGPGVYVFSSVTATAPNALTANVASSIMSVGPATTEPSNLPIGIKAVNSGTDAPIVVNYTGPGITTVGGNGSGIFATSGSGSIIVNASGPINTTNGSNAVGILADSGTALVYNSGVLTTDTTTRRQSPTSTTGSVQVNATNVSTLGQFGTGISATAGSGGVTVNILPGGLIMGGWQADLNSVGSTYGLPAAGVILGSSVGTATLTNDGSIGALSDRAVANDPNNTSVINNGTITGFVQLVGGNNSILNNGTFNLRHFADTTGGGRDTLRVAIADLGAGPNNIFTNNGTLALPAVTGATKLDSTGQYLPLGNPNNAMALGGPLQGHLIGVTTFTNSGTIDLQSNPVAGDVLVITGARQAGVAGPGTFVSNGGMLKLDTVLNEGGAATRSDTLVVDGTSVGSNGATKTVIRNAGGAGALTQGDGILVVQVLDPARSAAGAFVLAPGELRAGAFDYALFHGGVGGSNPADWFLRSDIVVPPVIPPVVPPVVPPETSLPPDPPPEPMPPGVYPIIGPELATYGVVQPLARQLGLSILGTLNDRVGDTYEPDGCVVAPAAASMGLLTKAKPTPAPCPLFSPSPWGRFFGQTVNNHYQAFADPRASGSLGGFQGGIDLLRGSLIAGHYERAGLYGAFGNVSADVTGLVTNAAATGYILTHTGSLNLEAGSAGGYWTHVGPGGWYLDAVLQGTWYGGSASTQFASLGTHGTGFIASLEGGVPFALPQFGPGFVLEPQGQMLWQKVSFRQANDGLGDVALGDTPGPSGRIGLRGKWTILTAGAQVWQPYLRANLWRDWGAGANAVYSGTDIVPLVSQATMLELGGGLTGRINANVSLFSNADYEFRVGAGQGDQRNGVRAAFGARYTW